LYPFISIDLDADSNGANVFVQVKFGNFENPENKFVLHMQECQIENQICTASEFADCDWVSIDEGHTVIQNGCVASDTFAENTFELQEYRTAWKNDTKFGGIGNCLLTN